MRGWAPALLVLLVAADVVVTIWITKDGLHQHAWAEERGWRQITDSAVDTLLLSAARAIVLLCVLLCACLAPHCSSSRTYVQVARRAVYWLSALSVSALASKAVVVAMYGGLTPANASGDGALPGWTQLPIYQSTAASGIEGLSSLALINVAIAVGIAASVMEYLLASLCLSSLQSSPLWQEASATEEGRTDEGDATEPLLQGIDGEAGMGDGDLAGAENKQNKKKKVAPAGRILSNLLQMVTPDWAILTTGFAFGALAAWTQALIPFYIGRIVQVTGREGGGSEFVALVRSLLLVCAGCAVFTGARGSLFTLEFAFLNRRLRSRLFSSLIKQDVEFFDKGKTGDLISRLSADSQSVSDSVCLNSNVLSRSLLQAAVVLYFMFNESEESWRLTVITFILVPVILAICKVYGGYFRQLQVNIQSALAEANTVAEEMLSSMTTVKAHAAEGSANDSYVGQLQEVYKLQARQAVVYLIFMVLQTFLPNAMSALVLFFGGSLIAQGKMDSGSLVAFMLYQQSLSAAFQAMGDVFSNLSGAVGAAEKVVELLLQKPTIPAPKGYKPSQFHGEVELRDVVFSYPTRPLNPVLNGLNLKIDSGEVVALVGPSGGGKSSIVKLMQRFYMPSRGQIIYDGVDVGDYDPSWLRLKMAMVGQEPVLYARSIYDNIVFGLPEDCTPSAEEVEQAAKLANAHSFISELPAGYHTSCGEKGVQMSGGQKQRIAIARALVRKPSILLLDEATSALDADSEYIVQEALDRVMRGRTTVVIAHRLSTVQDANRIVVVQHGTATESGTHQQLVASGGLYANLVKRQMSKASASFSSLSNYG